MSRLSRRQLLNIGLRGAAGAIAVPAFIPAGVLAAGGKPGPNERIAVGMIGVGHRGSHLMDQLPPAGRIVALSDCNLPRAEAYKAKKKGDWPVYEDYRKVLDRKDVDGVIVATGEFQRVLPCIHACQAGKDVYAEKPLTLYIREGRALVDAVRKYKRVLQVGTQQRSMAMNRIACELVRTGGLGPIREVLVKNYPGPDAALSLPEEKVPAGLNWDMWLNQAAFRPFNSQWMKWTHWQDFSGNWMTNWGAHGIDQVQWGVGMDGSGPVEMRPLEPGPNGQVEMRYANGVPVRFVLDFAGRRGPMAGCIFVCEKGKLEVNRNKFTSNPQDIADELLKKVSADEEEKKWGDQTGLWQAKGHLQNWLDCMRTRQTPVADVEIGHRTISVAHLMNITRRLGRVLKWDPAKEQFLGDDEANKLLDRPRRKGYELPSLG
jgi:predicted dehydrogenase